SLLTLWFYLVGSHGLFGAARAFCALALAMNAIALPVLVLRFAGRRALTAAALCGWPPVHRFSFALGVLDFSFAFGLALILIVVLDRQREHATVPRALGIAALSLAVWYAHPFPLAVVGVLVAVHVVTRSTWPERLRAARDLLAPLALAGLLSAVT